MNRYLKLLFRYLLGNLTRQVVAISSNSYFPYYFSLILLSRAICVVRWHVRMLATYVSQLSFLFAYDPLNRPKSYETSVRSKVLTFTGSCYFLFLLLFTALLYQNTDKTVWSHLNDLVARNREQVSFGWWRKRRRRSSESLNRRDSRRLSYQKLSTWLNRLKTFPFYPQLQVLPPTAKLLHYPKLAERLRLRAVRICFVFELLMVAIYFYYLNILYFDLVGQLRKLGQPMTIAQLITTAFAYLSILHTAFYTYAGLLLVELVLYLVCTVYAGQYQNLNRDLERVKASMLKNDSFQNLSSNSYELQNLNRSTAVYRAGHTRLTVFILRFNGSLVSKVIAYYLHYYLPYHSYRLVYIYFQQRSLPLAIAINSYWFLLFMWLFLMIITLGVARTNGEIGRSGRALSALFARKGLAMRVNFDQKRQSYYSAKESEAGRTIGHREALKLSTYFEMIWREEKQLAFTAGQTDTAMNWKFIFEVKTDFLQT